MFRKSSEGWLKHWDFMLLDFICLEVAFVVSYMMRHGFVNPYENRLYRNMAVFLVLADVVIIFFYETFKGVLKRGYYKEFAVTVKHTILVELFAVLYLFSACGKEKPILEVHCILWNWFMSCLPIQFG